MTHKWDYEPNVWNSSWENMPFYIRWPLAVMFLMIVCSMLLAPILIGLK